MSWCREGERERERGKEGEKERKSPRYTHTCIPEEELFKLGTIGCRHH